MLKGGYLKVLTPVTSNGVNPVMTGDGVDAKVKYRESHLHLMAKKRMENKNAKLPQHLKHIIEVVPDEPNVNQQVNETESKRTKVNQK